MQCHSVPGLGKVWASTWDSSADLVAFCDGRNSVDKEGAISILWWIREEQFLCHLPELVRLALSHVASWCVPWRGGQVMDGPSVDKE